MKFGIILPVEGNVGVKGKIDPHLTLDVGLRAEELGYDSVWAGERLLISQRLEPLSILAGVAGITQTIKLGTAVLIAPLRHPVILANQLASIDLVSNGRLIAGLGVGAERIKPEYDSVGVPFTERGGRLDECLSIMKKLWSEDTVDFHGKYYNLVNVSMRLKPKQRNGPPIWLGGTKKVSLQRVAKSGDGWVPFEILPQDYAVTSKSISDKALKNGRDPSKIERSLYITINVKEDVTSAKNEAHKYLESYYNAKFASIAKFGIFGKATDCVRAFEDYAKAGVETIIVRFASFSNPVEEIELFSKSVASLF